MDTTRNDYAAAHTSAGANDPAPPGFISAFDFAGGDALRLSWQEARKAIVSDGMTWLHLSANDDTVESWLEGVTALPDVAREFLNGEDKRPRVHMGPNFMFGVVADLELVATAPDTAATPVAREAIRATGALRFTSISSA